MPLNMSFTRDKNKFFYIIVFALVVLASFTLSMDSRARELKINYGERNINLHNNTSSLGNLQENIKIEQKYLKSSFLMIKYLLNELVQDKCFIDMLSGYERSSWARYFISSNSGCRFNSKVKDIFLKWEIMLTGVDDKTNDLNMIREQLLKKDGDISLKRDAVVDLYRGILRDKKVKDALIDRGILFGTKYYSYSFNLRRGAIELELRKTVKRIMTANKNLSKIDAYIYLFDYESK